MIKIYLSSTYEDLKEYRQGVLRALRALPGVKVVAMEDYGAFDERPLDKCLADVAACDAYIGIIAHRYGFRPIKGNPLHRSITELEYLEATEKGRPRFIYVIDPSMKWPPKFIDHDEDRRDLERFSGAIKHEHGIATFADENALAKKVAKDVLDKLKPAPGTISGSVGELAPKMCDRDLQEAAFGQFIRSALRANLRKPLLCFIPGREDACHDSFVDRMRYVYATALSDSAADDGEPLTVRARACNWIDEGSPDSCFNALITDLFKDLRHAGRIGDYSPRSLAELTLQSGREHAIIHHNIPYVRWKSAAPVLELYLRFWSDLANAPERPQFVIIFKVKLPVPSFIGSLLPGSRTSGFTELRHQVESLSAGLDCTTLIFDELGPVDRSHLDDWFSEFGIPRSEQERQLEMGRLFTRPDVRLPMARVQDHLQKICDRYEYELMEMNIG